ncbi:MAG: hypothetical protein AB7Y46_07660, partial [Armatimonadota bacterium]
MEALHPHPLMPALAAPWRIHLALLVGLLAVTPASCNMAWEVPADWQTSVISDCEDAVAFGAGRTPDRPRFDFAAWEVSTTTGARVSGQSLRWHMTPSSAQQREGRLMWSRSLSEPADVISLWLKNPNGHALELRLELVDLDGARYLSVPVDLATERNWRRIVFELAALTPAQGCADPFPGIDFPVVSLSLLVSPLETARPHTLYLDEIQAHRAPTLAAEVLEMQAPTSLAPGERVPVRVRLEAPEGLPPAARLAVQLGAEGGGALACAPLTPGQAVEGVLEATTADLRLPAWLPPGRYR